MLQYVTVTNHLGQSVDLKLGSPADSGLSILGIDGLGPPKAEIIFSEVVVNDGTAYNTGRVGSRNLVLTIGFVSKNGIDTIEQSRHSLYKYFPIKRKVRLDFHSDIRTAWTEGYVETNVVDVFSKQSSAQVSIICPEPYFSAFYWGEVLFSGLESNFSFPFKNNSLSQKLITFGTILTSKEKTIFYEGDARTGMMIDISFKGPVTFPTIYNVVSKEAMTIDTDILQTVIGGNQFVTGDLVQISTIRRNKYVNLVRDGTTYSLTSTIPLTTSWLELDTGDNTIAFDAVSGVDNMLFKITHPILYEGV